MKFDPLYVVPKKLEKTYVAFFHSLQFNSTLLTNFYNIYYLAHGIFVILFAAPGQVV